MRKFLSFLVGSFFVLVLFIILGSLLLPTPTPRAYEDPAMTSIKACAQHQERIQHATTDDHKAELLWWCTRNHYGLNR